jgi:serine/threonine protein kinase
MGAVWLAEDEVLHREVAIKEIQRRGRGDIRETDPEVRRVLREARAAAKLQVHSGIINVYDVVMHEGLPWIVMERLQGGSLADAMQNEGPLPVHRAAQIGVEILDALNYAHNNGVLHRDVKPGNVMLAVKPEGVRVVLTDFGIAVMDGDSVLTATGQVPGAPEYIAPERIKGLEATPAADMWSVGITLYHMVVGRTPFQRGDVQATLAAALSQKPDPHPNVGRLWPVIQGLLRDKPAERMPAAEAIAKLKVVAALPASAPDNVRIKVESYTSVEDPGDQVTIADETRPGTRTFLPAFNAPITSGPTVAPDDVTFDVQPPGPTTRKPMVLGAGVVALVAVVALVVWLAIRSFSSPAGQSATLPMNPSPNPTTAAPQPPTLKLYKEPWGFEIGVPVDWKRDATLEGPLSDVTWQGEQRDPAVGALKVQVTRDTTKTGMKAFEYLADKDDSERKNRDNAGYQRVQLIDRGDMADLEYTHGSAAGGARFHFRSRAVASGALYVLTFSMFANNPQILESQWSAAQPTMNLISDSFKVAGHPPR